MDSADLLEQLADIHLPGPVPFWPPAPGWWLLALLVIAALTWLTLKALEARRQKQICAFALHELGKAYHAYRQHERDSAEQVNQATLLYLNEFNAVLRRVALWHFPRQNVASLGGRDWVDFLRKKGESSLLSDQIAAALEEGRFKAQCDVDTEQLHQFGESWIESLYMSGSGSETSPKLSA